MTATARVTVRIRSTGSDPRRADPSGINGLGSRPTVAHRLLEARLVITHVLEDWISLRATNATTTFTQSEDGWLELGGFRDFTSWIQVMQASSAEISVRLQTSPTRDEQFFENVVTRNAVAANKVYVDPSRAKLVTGNGPVLSRFLRWSVVAVAPTSLWTIQFRIVLALNPVVPDFEMLCGGRRFANPGLSSPMGGMG